MNSTPEVADRLKVFTESFMSAQQCSDALMQFSEAYKARLKQAEADEEERARRRWYGAAK